MAEQTVTLAPGESKAVSFEVTPTMAKTYSVSVDGLSGSFSAIEAPEEIIDFDLTRPTVSPATITPGTAITITCPVTSRCTKLQTITAKVIIYEGSILPGHGSVIATKTSPSFSISPGEAYNVIVSHTAIAGTIDRRDIEVEIYIAGSLVKQSEWDDVYYVEKPALPEVIVDLDALSVLDVEGVEFTSIGTQAAEYDWTAFGKCLHDSWAISYYGSTTYITSGYAIADCMSKKNLLDPADQTWGDAMKQCGIDHPEYVTDFAKSVAPPRRNDYCTVWAFHSYYGVYPYIGLVIEDEFSRVEVTRCTGSCTDSRDICHFDTTYKQTWWELQNMTGIVRDCYPYGYGLGEILTATLAEPIVMDKIRGVSLRWLNKTIPTYADCGTIWILQYKPAFSAPMPPPGFRLISLRPQAVGEIGTAPITGCYAGGYYYPGIYDGIITVEAGCGYRDGTFTSYAGGGRFMIKNLAKVTGTGTVVPPGY